MATWLIVTLIIVGIAYIVSGMFVRPFFIASNYVTNPVGVLLMGLGIWILWLPLVIWFVIIMHFDNRGGWI